MEFEWDPAKSNTCASQRGFDFAYAVRAFIDPKRCIKQDTRYNYGKDRYILFGMIEGRLFCIAYTVRGTTFRIISARKANLREVKNYEHYQSIGER